jgi:hypothetical protein
MSIVDLDNMTPTSLVAQYVVELLGTGHCLSRDDVARVDQWLSLSSSMDELLLVLDEILPKRVEKTRNSGRKITSLALFNKIVQKRLSARRALTGGSAS